MNRAKEIANECGYRPSTDKEIKAMASQKDVIDCRTCENVKRCEAWFTQDRHDYCKDGDKYILADIIRLYEVTE